MGSVFAWLAKMDSKKGKSRLKALIAPVNDRSVLFKKTYRRAYCVRRDVGASSDGIFLTHVSPVNATLVPFHL